MLKRWHRPCFCVRAAGAIRMFTSLLGPGSHGQRRSQHAFHVSYIGGIITPSKIVYEWWRGRNAQASPRMAQAQANAPPLSERAILSTQQQFPLSSLLLSKPTRIEHCWPEAESFIAYPHVARLPHPARAPPQLSIVNP
jgi:hypothetical protein